MRIIILFYLFTTAHGAINNTCYGVAPYDCLPGVSGIGVGFDAVYGTSTGKITAVEFSFELSKQGKNNYDPPFAKTGTLFSYPDQTHLDKVGTDQSLETYVYRSMRDYLHQTSVEYGINAGFGGFLSASVESEATNREMDGGNNVVSFSKLHIGLYSLALKPSLLLNGSSDFQQYVAKLPEKFDDAIYGQFIKDWGTHYVKAITLGGLARMRATTSQSYYSQHADSDIAANMGFAWGLFGGGGHVDHKTTTDFSTFQSSTDFKRDLNGGDPAVSWNSTQGWWKEWADSVEKEAPTVVKTQLEWIYELLPAESAKRDNIMKAVFQYAQAHNKTYKKPVPPAVSCMKNLKCCVCGTDGTFTASNSCACGTTVTSPFSPPSAPEKVTCSTKLSADGTCPCGFMGSSSITGVSSSSVQRCLGL